MKIVFNAHFFVYMAKEFQKSALLNFVQICSGKGSLSAIHMLQMKHFSVSENKEVNTTFTSPQRTFFKVLAISNYSNPFWHTVPYFLKLFLSQVQFVPQLKMQNHEIPETK